MLTRTTSSTTSASPLDEQQRQLFVDVRALSAYRSRAEGVR